MHRKWISLQEWIKRFEAEKRQQCGGEWRKKMMENCGKSDTCNPNNYHDEKNFFGKKNVCSTKSDWTC